MTQSGYRAAVAAWACVALQAAAAAAQSWTALASPPGGDVRALASDPRDPRVVYLGTADGVLYRSDDAGGTWQRLVPGFPQRGYSLDEIAITPGGEVVIGYWEIAGGGGGVARSTDGGRTFRLASDVAGQSVRAVALAPSRPTVVVAGTLGGVFRSDDGGGAWHRISPEGHAEIRNVESIAIDPTDPDVVFAGTWHLAWKTADGGRTWRPAHAGIIEDSDIFTLTYDRRSPRVMYATACSGIYRSRDAGAGWAKIRGIPASSRRTRAFAQDPEHPERLYAGTTEGLWVSEDDGATWRLATQKDLVVNSILILPGGAVLLGCDGAGVLRSLDRAQTFEARNDGFGERFVSRLRFDAAHGRVLAAVAGDRFHAGVLQAPRPEGPWTKIGMGLEGREVLSIVPVGAEVLAGTDDGVYVSASHCGLWRRLPTATAGIDWHPRVADVAASGESIFLAATAEGLLRSTDAGETWTLSSLGYASSVSAVVTLPTQPATALAATPLGVFRSTDEGAHWTQVSQALGATIRAFVPVRDDARVVFATSPGGLMKSFDQGATWYARGGGLPLSDITGVAVSDDGRTVYASDFSLGGIYQSGDGGNSWSRIATDGLTSDRVWAVALESAAGNRLLAATTGGLHARTAAGDGAVHAAP